MTDTKTPPDPETGCAPLDRPLAETVSLDLVWAAAFTANELVEELLVTHPRGARKTEVDHG